MNSISLAIPALPPGSAVFALSTAFLFTIVPGAEAQLLLPSTAGSIQIQADLEVQASSPSSEISPLTNILGGLTEPRSSSLFFEEGQESLEREIQLLMERELIDSENLLDLQLELGEEFGEEIQEIDIN